MSVFVALPTELSAILVGRADCLWFFCDRAWHHTCMSSINCCGRIVDGMVFGGVDIDESGCVGWVRSLY